MTDVPFIPPPLPREMWALIVRHALDAAAADGYRALLRTATVLLAVSRMVAAAAREQPLDLDLRQAPQQDLHLLTQLAAALPLRTLRLAPCHASGAEALLRSDGVAARSGGSLGCLAASVACADTLQRYGRLQELHLHAGVVARLYPAVLHGLRLAHLGLHGYEEVELAGLPNSLAETLRVLEVTPKPEAMRCRLLLRLPPRLRLRRLTVHGSIGRLLSSKAAPLLLLDTAALCRQCEEVRVEAGQAVWSLLAAAPLRPGQLEAALAAALLHPQAAWRRLEVLLLEEAMLQLLLPSDAAGGAPQPLLRCELDLQQLVQAVLQLGQGRVLARLRSEQVSIFGARVLELERQRPGPAATAGTRPGAVEADAEP